VLGIALACWSGGGLAQDLLPTPRGQLGGKVPLPTPAIPVTPPVPPLATIPIVLAPAPAAPTSPAPSLVATTTASVVASPGSAAQAADSVVTIQVAGVTAGSGSIVADGGVVVTARDVVGASSDVDMIDARGDHVAASVVGVDPESGLAVLHADRAIGPALAFSAATAAVGDPVVAVGGDGASGSQPSVHGVVASTGIWFPSGPPAVLLLETDVRAPASANGGPLIDAQGALAGVLIDDRLAGSPAASPSSGVGGSLHYAVPAPMVARVVDGLLSHGQVDYPFWGMAVAPATDDPAGPIRIGDVIPGSPAAQAGLQAGDVLIALDAVSFGPRSPASVELLMHVPGDRVQVRVRRDGVERTVDVALGARPTP
jgi:S1-C subfamily serine protease